MYNLVWSDGYGKHCVRSDDYQAMKKLYEALKAIEQIESGIKLCDEYCTVIMGT